MIKVTELRIGNLIKTNGKIVEVDYLTPFSIGYGNGKFATFNSILVHFEPIPITEDWLVKAGFKKDKSNFKGEVIFVKNSFLITESRMFFIIVGWDSMEFINYSGYEINDGDNKIDSVHQLQNLYFALTGEELTINQ